MGLYRDMLLRALGRYRSASNRHSGHKAGERRAAFILQGVRRGSRLVTDETLDGSTSRLLSRSAAFTSLRHRGGSLPAARGAVCSRSSRRPAELTRCSIAPGRRDTLVRALWHGQGAVPLDSWSSYIPFDPTGDFAKLGGVVLPHEPVGAVATLFESELFATARRSRALADHSGAGAARRWVTSSG